MQHKIFKLILFIKHIVEAAHKFAISARSVRGCRPTARVECKGTTMLLVSGHSRNQNRPNIIPTLN